MKPAIPFEVGAILTDSRYDHYSVECFDRRGRRIGDEFQTMQEAQRYANCMTRNPDIVSIALFGWPRRDGSDDYPQPTELELWYRLAELDRINQEVIDEARELETEPWLIEYTASPPNVLTEDTVPSGMESVRWMTGLRVT